MIGLFGVVKDEKPRQRRNLESEILSLLGDAYYGLTEYDIVKKLGIKKDKVITTLNIMRQHDKIRYNYNNQKWVKVRGRK